MHDDGSGYLVVCTSSSVCRLVSSFTVHAANARYDLPFGFYQDERCRRSMSAVYGVVLSRVVYCTRITE